MGDSPSDAAPLQVQTVAVVGAGTMGAGIAMACANAGLGVWLTDREEAAVERGLQTIRQSYESGVARGRLTREEADERIARIGYGVDTASDKASDKALARADLVIEAVFEDMAIKQALFAALDRICKPDAILATNTSTLDIDQIAAATARPASIVGLHFFSPAHVMRLLEIVRGAHTSPAVIAAALQLAARLKKIGVVVGNGFGFVGNRLFQPYRREAQFLVEEGASIEAVDRALRAFGMAMGPLTTADLAGLDIGWRIRQSRRHLLKPGVRTPIAEDRLCEIGRLGQKTGAGWYRYDAQRQRIADPDVEALVRGWAADAGITARGISDDEIVDRCIYALVNEGARAVEDGTARRAADIDVIYLNGYGFPASRGGPMAHADSMGLPQVVARIEQFHREHGVLWEPAPLLVELARTGRTFADHDRTRDGEPHEQDGRDGPRERDREPDRESGRARPRQVASS